MKALIILPNPIESKIIRDNLEAEGMTVLETDNGTHAMETLKTQPDIGIVLLDDQLADIPYEDFVKQVLDDANISDIPIILMENNNNLFDPNEPRPFGVYFVLTKPVERALLSSVMDSAVRHKQHIESSLGSW
ncbi:MAG: response regulator [Hyphomicrobiales bacterium]|nr:response regulator [Rickettsiales bacterium]MCP5361422.1 response regulator [Hyphomicrobiales bacterium]